MGLNHVAYHGNKNCNDDWLNGYFQAKKDLEMQLIRSKLLLMTWIDFPDKSC